MSIIVEGPDGAGKTRLVQRLAEDLGLPVHERASTSVGGPVADLWNWTCRDVNSWEQQPLSIYDRHPLISEYIYGPIVRGSLSAGFAHPTARAQLHKMSSFCLVIFCLPPLETVTANIGAAAQMPGVVPAIEAIYYSYVSRRASWEGWAADYNYLTAVGKGSYESVRRAARLHMVERARA